MTGVNPVTLRAWQRRYGLVNPERTAKGHRLYSAQDVERIRQILRWLEQGVSIGQVGSLLATPQAEVSTGDDWRRAVAALHSAAVDINIGRLDSLLDEYCALYPSELLLRHVLEPWLQELASLQRPDRQSLQQIVHCWLASRLAQKTRIQSGPWVALGSLGEASPLTLGLLNFELQGLECRGRLLGSVAPTELPLLSQRLPVHSWVIHLGAGLTASRLREAQTQLPQGTLLVGALGRAYQDRGWLSLPWAETLSELARMHHDAFSVVQNRSAGGG